MDDVCCEHKNSSEKPRLQALIQLTVATAVAAVAATTATSERDHFLTAVAVAAPVPAVARRYALPCVIQPTQLLVP
jgi:enolase